MGKTEWLSKANITAGIHTAEIRTGSLTYCQRNLPYLRSSPTKIGNEWHIQINPHKAYRTQDGKYQCLFGKSDEVKQVIEQAKQEMQWGDDWRYSRIDYAFNIEAPYEETTRLTRLFVVLLAESLHLDNRYYSTDPLTEKEKSVSVRTANTNAPAQYAIEHYNRALLDQSEYDTPIINRLELRLIGKAITQKQDAYASVSEWFRLIDEAVTEDALSFIEDKLTSSLCGQWERTMAQTGFTRIQQFVRANSRHVYTRSQLIKILTCAGVRNPAQTLKDMLRARGGYILPLYDMRDLQTYAMRLREAYALDSCAE